LDLNLSFNGFCYTTDVAEVKQKWTKLKEKYCRERGSIKKPNGSPVDEPHTSKWALFECISFYDKYIQQRR
jgi:hypothetical protein